MPYTNLPRTSVTKEDGNLVREPAAATPRVLVVGTAGQGQADATYYVQSTSAARTEFGTDGTLIRGMYEVMQAGAKTVALYRIGATAAQVAGIGDTSGAAGYTVSTVVKDDAAGDDYSMYYDDATNRLVVRRNSDYLVVFDNNTSAPIDLFEVTVSGHRAAAGGPDIGSASGFVNLEDVTGTGLTYTAGTDGTNLSKMELYEKLYVAYKDLLTTSFDVIVPMGVFFDDMNIVAQGHTLGAITPVLAMANTYPTAGAFTLGTEVDSLGYVYVEEYLGEYYFWWTTNKDSFTAAILYPSVGSASATLKIDGTALAGSDFHEVNFGYQLARFLYEYSTDIVDATGVIGCLPPDANTLRDKALWYGKKPTYTLNPTTGAYYIASAGDNGSGLLGNKFLAGMASHRSGVFGGGMILTDGEFMDGTEQVDTNNVAVDLGKYISVVADTAFLRNPWYTAGYLGTLAPTYAGFYANMNVLSSPTNKSVPTGINIVYKLRGGTVDDLAGTGYVALLRKDLGVVWADAPMATLPNSDWNRLSTVRKVKDVIDGVRAVADPYLGETLSPAAKQALQTAIENVLQLGKKQGYLIAYRPVQIIQTPDMAIVGQAQCPLVLQIAPELRELQLPISLSKQL